MLLPKRIWKDIPGYEGLYQVSNTGQVRSLGNNKSKKTKILKTMADTKGYKRLTLYKNSKKKTYKVHRLVAQAFIPNPNDLPEVNHKDENKANNAVWNLEWCTHEYNMNFGTVKERVSKTKRNKKHCKAKPILMYTLDGQFIKRFDSIADANEFLGKDRHKSNNISACLRGCKGQKTAYGYIWKYE